MTINDIFLVAKAIAILKQNKEISKTTFFEALNHFYIKNGKFLKLLKSQGYEPKEFEIEINRNKILQAKYSGEVNFTQEIIAIKRLFLKNSFDIEKTDIGTLKSNTKSLLAKIKDTKVKLKDRIFSQDMAIDAVMSKIAGVGSKNANSIRGIFFFLGPPATGKTELAKTLKDFFDGYRFKEFSMAHYKHEDDASFKLVGSTPVWNRAAEGELTKFVKENPRSIILFDEIEKAYINVQDIFLDILGSGFTRDQFSDEEIDFRECIFVFTSNVGSELYRNESFLKLLDENAKNAEDMILEKLSSEYNYRGENLFKPEFLSRISQGEIVLFNKLNYEAYEKIAKPILDDKIANFEKDYAKIKFNETAKKELIKILILNMLPSFDAREIKSKFSQKMFKRLQDFLIDRLDLDIKEICISVEQELIKSIDKILENTTIDKFINDCFRKNQTIDLKHSIDVKDGILNLIYKNAELKKLPKSSDFGGGVGSILVDLPDTCFEDIAGHNKVKARLKEITRLLLNKEELKKYGIHAPRGMLLYGPPGTGKTMLAKAFAHEADLPFIQTTGTEILDIETMQNVFKRAREYAPSIIFIDEIDVFGSREDGTRFDVQINQLLTEINGFSDGADIFIIAATNLPEKLDPAITRSGRIDLKVEVGMLDPEARGYFIDKILELPTAGKIDREKLIKFSSFMSGADLSKVKREASYEVIKRGLDGISQEILLEQINTVKYGEKISSKSIQDELSATAYHEAGHAVISHLLRPEIKIEQITVMPRGKALGFVSYNQDEMQTSKSFEYIKNEVLICLAGRTAEKKISGEKGINSGASNDLERATNLLFWATKNLGMGKFGSLNLANQSKTGYIAELAEKEVLELMAELSKKCEALIEENWDKIDKIAKTLIEKEMIDESEFLEILK